MENENALMMDVSVAEATNQSEREQAVEMTHRFRRRYWMKPKTLGADKGYDDGKFLHELESDMGIVPHVATRAGPMKAQDEGGEARRRARRRKKTKGYRRSQRVRKQVEPVIGWLKQVAELRRARFVGRWKTQLYAYAAGAAYNLMRLGNLSTA